MQTNAQAVGQGTSNHAALVARIAAGDRSAETEFVLAFQAGVRALVRRHARPADPSIDDLVQDVLHTVIMRLRDNALHDAHTLPAYVRSTVVFVVTAEYRKRDRRGENDTSPLSADALPDPDQPDHHARREQLHSSVNRVLSELSVERDREVLRRYYLMEEDRDTVCAVLSIEPDHFHRVLHRARARMKELLVQRGIANAQ
ncbi:MAG: RNA polymerase sigma factor [Porticoccaceae bacterium]